MTSENFGDSINRGFKHPSELTDDNSGRTYSFGDHFKNGCRVAGRNLERRFEGISKDEVLTIVVCASASLALTGVALSAGEITATVENSVSWTLDQMSIRIRPQF